MNYKHLFILTVIAAFMTFMTAVKAGDPEGFWCFEEGSGSSTADETTNNNDGTLTNMDTANCWINGILGSGSYALEFDGTEDHVLIPHDASLSASSAVTIEAWIKPDTRANSSHVIACKGSKTYFFEVTDGYLNLMIGKSSGGATVWNVSVLSNQLLDASKWYHVAATFQNGIGKVYINGILDTVQVGEDLNIPTNTKNLSIGSASSYYSGYFFDGVIDDLKVYTEELGQCEIQQSVVFGEWNFDEGTGTSTADETSYANDGTLTNGPLWVDGKSGYALDFDGTDDYVSVPHDESLDMTQEMTIEAWVKLGTTSGGRVIACKGAKNYFFEISNGRVSFLVGRNDPYGWNVLPCGSTTMNTTDWYHVAATYKDGVGKVYLNGVLDGSDTGSDDPIRANTSDLSIGSADSYSPNYRFDGAIDGLKIHRVAFNETEILRRYYAADLRGSWKFDDTDYSSSTVDSSGEGNDGTLTNMSTPACWIDGRVGRAVELDGTNDYINCGNDSSLAITDEISVEAWIKPDTRTGNHVIASKGSYTYSLAVNGGKAEFKIGKSNRSGWNSTATGTTTLDSEKYYHIVGTYKDGVSKVYVNATTEDTDTGSNEDIGSYSANLSIGADSTSANSYFDGVIDQVNVFSRALSSTEISQRFTAHGGLYGFGCEEYKAHFNEPIGGGEGYSDIMSIDDADYYVDTQTELTTAISNASSGDMIFIDMGADLDLSEVTVPAGVTLVYDVSSKTELLDAMDDTYTGDKVDIVFVDGSVTIDLTGEHDISIPEGVTLASDRGYNDGSSVSSGALLKTDCVHTNNMYPLFITGGSDVRVTGIRIQGGSPDTTSTGYNNAIKFEHPNMEVDNCEISAFGHAALYLYVPTTPPPGHPMPTNAYIHHNYIHHCQKDGNGYGVHHGKGEATSVIEANKFDYIRHAVAGTGRDDNIYEAKFNLIMGNRNGHVFDMHQKTIGEVTYDVAGDKIYIHHNTIEKDSDSTWYAVAIRSIPKTEALIYNNWIVDRPGVVQRNTTGIFNIESYRNMYSENRHVIMDDVIVDDPNN